LVEELRQVCDQASILTRDHEIQIRGVHTHHLLQGFNLDLTFGKVCDTAHESTFVEDYVKIVSVAFVIKGVVDHRFEHALVFEVGILRWTFLEYSLHLEEVESIEYDCTCHFWLGELRWFGRGLNNFSLFRIQRVDKTTTDFTANFARVEAFHA